MIQEMQSIGLSSLLLLYKSAFFFVLHSLPEVINSALLIMKLNVVNVQGFFDSIGICCCILRLHYFTISLWKKYGILLLAFGHMWSTIFQFLMAYVSLIFGFGSALGVIYGTTSSNWSGVNQFFSATQNVVVTYLNLVSNSGLRWNLGWGDFFLIILFLICNIVLLNMLIAMMNSKFSSLIDNNILRQELTFFPSKHLL